MLTQAYREIGYLWSMASTVREKIGMARFIALLYAARLLPIDTYRWSTTVRLHGSRYRIGLRTSEIYIFDEIYGQKMYDRIGGYTPQPGWTVVDLGANAGLFSVHAAKQGAEVHAFEPNDACYERLEWTIANNDLADRITAHNQGASDRNGSAWLQVERGGTTGGTVVDSRPTSGSSIDLIRLDDALAPTDVADIDLLKMDIEGAEVEALRGAEQTLGKTRRIIAEYHSAALLEDMTAILEAKGFEEDLRFVYYDAADADGGEEVGMIYASRRR